LPETYPGIEYDSHGVCNHCRTHHVRPIHGKAALDNLVDTRRARTGPYDSIVALSGGRDSTYVAYYAAKVLGLKPLLYTFDNGMMPEQTVENVKGTARLLGLDHVVEKSDKVVKNAKHIMSCWVHRPSPAMIGLLCSGCRTGYVRGLAKTARAHRIPLVLTGGGEPERSFAQILLSSTN
jgi:tRNA(Ile)-lysidine synthase TilS/MesJ